MCCFLGPGELHHRSNSEKYCHSTRLLMAQRTLEIMPFLNLYPLQMMESVLCPHTISRMIIVYSIRTISPTSWEEGMHHALVPHAMLQANEYGRSSTLVLRRGHWRRPFVAEKSSLPQPVHSHGNSSHLNRKLYLGLVSKNHMQLFRPNCEQTYCEINETTSFWSRSTNFPSMINLL